MVLSIIAIIPRFIYNKRAPPPQQQPDEKLAIT
eukprot:UN10301